MKFRHCIRTLITLVIHIILIMNEAPSQEFGPVSFSCPPCGCIGDSVQAVSAGTCAECGMETIEYGSLKNVAVFIYDNVQLLDIAGAYSVFEAARSFHVYTVAENVQPVTTTSGNMKILPHYTFASCPEPDILIVPGGLVGNQLRNRAAILWLQDVSRQSKIVLSVCTGAFILAKTGLLDGLSSTVLEEDIEQLKKAAPKVNVVSGKRYVDNGKFLSAAGPASGADASLHILTRIFGNTTRAKAAARYLDYVWHPQ